MSVGGAAATINSQLEVGSVLGIQHVYIVHHVHMYTVQLKFDKSTTCQEQFMLGTSGDTSDEQRCSEVPSEVGSGHQLTCDLDV